MNMSLRGRIALWALMVGVMETALLSSSCTSSSSKRPKPPTFTLTPIPSATPAATSVGGTATLTVMQTATQPMTPTATVTLAPPANPTVVYFEVGSLRTKADICGQTTQWVDGWSFSSLLCETAAQGIGNVATVVATGVPIVYQTPLSVALGPDTSSSDPYCKVFGTVKSSLNGLPGPTFQVTPGESFSLAVIQLTPGSVPFPAATAVVDLVIANSNLPQITTDLCTTPPGANFVIQWTPPGGSPAVDYMVVTVVDFLSGAIAWGPNVYLPTWNWAYITGLSPGVGYALLVTGVWHTGIHPNAPDSGGHGILFTD